VCTNHCFCVRASVRLRARPEGFHKSAVISAQPSGQAVEEFIQPGRGDTAQGQQRVASRRQPMQGRHALRITRWLISDDTLHHRLEQRGQ